MVAAGAVDSSGTVGAAAGAMGPLESVGAGGCSGTGSPAFASRL